MRPGPPGRSPKNSFFINNFLDMTASTPYIGPVNARSAPAAACRRPRKKRTKKQAGTFPLSGPPPPIGHPIPDPMRHPVRRRGLTAGPRPVRPSASAGPRCPSCRPAVPPPVSSALPLGRKAGKIPIGTFFAHSRIAVSQRFRGVRANREPARCKKNAVGRPVCPFSGDQPVRPLLQKNPLQRGSQVGVRRWQTCGAEPAQAQAGRTPPSTPDKSGAASPAEAGDGCIAGVAASQGNPGGGGNSCLVVGTDSQSFARRRQPFRISPFETLVSYGAAAGVIVSVAEAGGRQHP